MKNGNQKPTKQELHDVGFITSIMNLSYFYKDIQGEIVQGIGVDLKEESISLLQYEPSSKRKLNLELTKENLNNQHLIFTGEELGFEPKEKDYSWESCIKDAEHAWMADNSGITHIALTRPEEHNYLKHVFKTEAQAKQSWALAQLYWIIAAINEDYPKTEQDDITQNIFLRGECPDMASQYRNNGENKMLGIFVDTIQGAKILIKQHSELLKQALCLTK